MDNFIGIINGKFILPILASILLAVGIAGCTPPEQTVFHHTGPFHQIPRQGKGTLDLVRTSYSIADALIAELRKSHPSFDPNVPVLVTSFVNRSSLETTSELGLLLADHVASRMTQQGYTIVEPKLRQDLSIRKEEGEFILSRDVERLHQENGAFATVVGSYTETRHAIDLTTKIVGVGDRKVLASVDVRMPLERASRELLLSTDRGTLLEVVAQ